MKNKKELLEAVLVYLLGLLCILALAWNANQYDKKFPNENINIQAK